MQARLSNDARGRAASRRRFLQTTGAAAASLTWAGQTPIATAAEPPGRKAKPPKPFQLGVASYTFRKFDLEKALAMTRRVGLRYICFKSFHLPLEATPDQIAAAVAKVQQAGLVLYSGGVITMRNQKEIDQAFEYARAAGMKMIIGAPTAEVLPLVDAKIRQTGIAVAIHNHGPGDKNFPTPQSVYEKVKDFDRRLGLCIDVGHTIRVGADPVESARKYADRLLDVHMKDVTAATPKGSEIEVGRGIIDIPGLLRTLMGVNFAGVVSFEYEPQPDDPLPGLAESVGYVKGVLAML
jgi:sugar phosphate isomerase/epimerase